MDRQSRGGIALVQRGIHFDQIERRHQTGIGDHFHHQLRFAIVDATGHARTGTGRDLRINIDDGSGACIYDFKAQFTNGQELTRFRINVCEVSEYTYTR